MDKIFKYKNSNNTHRTSAYRAPYNSRHGLMYNLYYGILLYYIILYYYNITIINVVRKPYEIHK